MRLGRGFGLHPPFGLNRLRMQCLIGEISSEGLREHGRGDEGIVTIDAMRV